VAGHFATGLGLAVLGLAVGGCMGGVIPDVASKAAVTASPADPAAQSVRANGSARIASLQSRRSLVPNGSSFDTVARSVTAASAGTAQSDLRIARLKAEAKSKNWLPSIGPSVNLTSLGALVTSILVEQVIFDNGKRKAERAFAAADVEVAAVNLSLDMNKRVQTGLMLYIDAEAARARAAVAQRALGRLEEFDRIMVQRVQGGVSNLSEQQVLRQKLSEMQAQLSEDQDTIAQALAELASISASPLGGVSGLAVLPEPPAGVTPLTVLLAEAERERTVAEARMTRAGLLPGLTAGGTIGGGGSGIGLSVSAKEMWGFGTGASLKALDAASEGADRHVAQAQEDAGRRVRSLEQKLVGMARQEAREAEIVGQTRANLDLFEAQYRAGQRPLMDLVNQFEQLAGMERDLVTLRYDRARTQVELARELGVLADGAEI